jgi:hypothetical protein
MSRLLQGVPVDFEYKIPSDTKLDFRNIFLANMGISFIWCLIHASGSDPQDPCPKKKGLKIDHDLNFEQWHRDFIYNTATAAIAIIACHWKNSQKELSDYRKV